MAVKTCKDNGYSVIAVVIDSAGAPKAVLIGDGTSGLLADMTQRKAETALAFNEPSGAVNDAAKTDASVAAKLKADPKLLPWAGGIPIEFKGQTIGAIGVGGAPGGDKDEACAKAALAQVADLLQ